MTEGRPRGLGFAVQEFFLLTPRGGRLAAMEGLRGVSVALVFIAHVSALFASTIRSIPVDDLMGWPPWSLPRHFSALDVLLVIASRSHYGVDVFFLLSGFLVFRIVERGGRELSYVSFLKHRALRIYPAFLVTLLAAIWLRTKYLQYFPLDWLEVGKNLLFLNGIPDSSAIPYNYVTWSLFYEFLFYLLVPAIHGLWATAKSPVDAHGRWARLAGMPAIALLALILTSVLWLPRFAMFYFGAALGARKDEDLHAYASRVSDGRVGLLGLGAVLFYVAAPTSKFFPPMVGVAASLVLIKGCYGAGPIARVLRWTPLRFMGNISYSVYLVHTLCTEWWMHKLRSTSWAARQPWLAFAAFGAVALVCTTLVGAASFALFERWYFVRAKADSSTWARAARRHAVAALLVCAVGAAGVSRCERPPVDVAPVDDLGGKGGWKDVSGLEPSEGPFPQLGWPRVRWGLAPATVLDVPARDEREVFLHARMRSAPKDQSVTVVVNGVVTATHRLAGNADFEDATFPLPLRAGQNRVELRYVSSQSTSSDPRKLAVAFSVLSVESAK